MVLVYHAALQDHSPGEWDSPYFQLLPSSFRERITRLKRPQDRLASLAGKALLAQGLKELGLDAARLSSLRVGPHNRPELSGGIDFNIAHCEGHVVCALSCNHRVGVDIELVRDLPLSQYLSSLPPKVRESIETAQDKVSTFFRYWTMVEAVLKADGRGMGLPLSEVYLLQGGALVEGKRWHLCELRLAPHTVCHLCAKAPH